MANVYAQWNPSDKSANTTLSNGNLTATHATIGAAYNGVRSDLSKTSGKWYWEYALFTVGGNNAVFVGMGTSGASLTNSGSNVNKYMYLTQGFSENNGVETGGFASWGPGDTIGVAYDADGQTVACYKNNALQFTLSSVPTGLFAMINFFDNGDSVTANFGATTLAFTPPSGFNAGLYTQGAGGATLPFKSLLGVGI